MSSGVSVSKYFIWTIYTLDQITQTPSTLTEMVLVQQKQRNKNGKRMGEEWKRQKQSNTNSTKWNSEGKLNEVIKNI